MKYRVCLIDPDTGEPTPEGFWASEHARFDNLVDAEQAVFGLQRAWPGAKWQINEVGWPGTKWQASKTPEPYWSADLKQWITSSSAAPM